MSKKIKKTIILFVIMIISSNISSFADRTEFQELVMTTNLDTLVKNVNEEKITAKKAAAAIGNNEVTNQFVSTYCYPTFSKNMKDKEISNMKKIIKNVITSDKELKNYNKWDQFEFLALTECAKLGISGKDGNTMAKRAEAYVRLEQIELRVEELKTPGDKKSADEVIKKIENDEKKAEESESNTDTTVNSNSETDGTKDTPIYVKPNATTTGNGSSESSLEDMTKDAEKFVNSGNTPAKAFTKSLQNFSKTMYNILLTIGIFVAVIVGGIIGIKLMTSSAEGKAEAKALLIPYVVGCVVVFGGFGIWKLVVTLLQNI